MKIKKIERDGDFFVMTVQHEDGHKEEWTYTREETASGVSYSMVGREDA